MILARIIERITVDRNYNLTITFFITRDEFEAAMSKNEGLRIEQALSAPTLSFVAS